MAESKKIIKANEKIKKIKELYKNTTLFDFLNFPTIHKNNLRMKITMKSWPKFYRKFINSDFLKMNHTGVYMIGDFYIGRSKNIKDRVKKHIYNSINLIHTNKHAQSRIIKDLLENEKLKVCVLSTNPSDEEYYIKKYRNSNYHLLNRDFLLQKTKKSDS